VRNFVGIAAEGGTAAGRFDTEAVVEGEEWFGGSAAELGQVGTWLWRNLTVDFGGHGSENERLRLGVGENGDLFVRAALHSIWRSAAGC
jgi:hypothetical protein